MGEPSLEWIPQPQRTPPILSSARSAPVSTASTPGMALAALASIFVIFARACGERRKCACVSPGRVMSSVYWPLPVMKRKSSLRRTAAPMPVAFMAVSWLERVSQFPCVGRAHGRPSDALGGHGLGAGRDRLDDVVIAGAAAEVALELLADGLLVELVAPAADAVDRPRDHTGG